MWVTDSDAARAVLVPAPEAGALLADSRATVLLGIDDARAYFATVHGSEPPGAGRVAPLREVAALLPAEEAGLAACARSYALWHLSHEHCARCGATSSPIQAGHQRRCDDPACGALHFPRSDPAMIVLVTRGDRCLLGRQPNWPPRMHSTLAGFVEPGETLEQAVVREVYEETGIAVDGLFYRGSQPWPFPSSLMLGFRARALTDEVVLGDDELESARWFERGELVAAVDAGEVALPLPFSIAHALITEWLKES